MILSAALALLLLACAGAADAKRGRRTPPAGKPAAVAFQTVLQRGVPGQSGGEIREAARDDASWRALWDRLRQGDSGALPAEPPAIDFSREMAVVAAMPTQGCVSKVTIRSVTQGNGEAVVNLLEAPPAPNCVCIVAQRPLHVIRLPRLTGEIRFVAERGQTSCGRVGG